MSEEKRVIEREPRIMIVSDKRCRTEIREVERITEALGQAGYNILKM